MKAFFNHAKLSIIIFAVAAFLTTLSSAAIVKASYIGDKELNMLSENFVMFRCQADMNEVQTIDKLLMKMPERNMNWLLIKRHFGWASVSYANDYLFNVEMIQGRVFSQRDFEKQTNLAIISEWMLNETFEIDNDQYIRHFGEPYEVIGIYKSIMGTTAMDINYYVSMEGNSLRHDPIDGEYYLDSRDKSYEVANKLIESLKDEGYITNGKLVRGHSKEADQLLARVDNVKGMILVIMVSGVLVVLNAYSAIRIWIKGRKKEMGIRLLLGANIQQIYFWMLTSYFRMISVSFVLGLFLAYMLIINAKNIEAIPTIYYLFGDKFAYEYVIFSYMIVMLKGIIVISLVLWHDFDANIIKHVRVTNG